MEFIEYLKSEYGKDAAYHADLFLKTLPAEVIEQKHIKNHFSEFKGKIKEKDLPHLIAAEISKVEYIVSYDRDFKRANKDSGAHSKGIRRKVRHQALQ